MKKIFLILFTLILTGCSADQAELLSFGIVDNETIGTEKNENLVSGMVRIIDSWNLVKSTNVIPNKLSIEFGIAYKIVSPFYRDSSVIEEVIVFPDQGLTNPVTDRTAKYDSEVKTVNSGEKEYFSFKFDSPWEAKSGEWLFQVKQNGVVLLEQAFEVEPKVSN